MSATAHSFAATTHGRYLTRPGRPDSPLLCGFHGYAESCEIQMTRLSSVPDLDAWTLVSIQGLHRFYRRRSDEVVASWMTRQDRELMIDDNLAYVDGIIATVRGGAVDQSLVFAGFSQGVSMAFRAACRGSHPVAAVVACGGDVPPELSAGQLRRAGRALIGRGRDDALYTGQMMDADVARLSSSGVAVDRVVVDGGHEWSGAFSAAVASFLTGVVR